MDKNSRDGFLRRALRFIGDRAFYLVLFLCVAVIGITAWIFSAALETTKPKESAQPSLSARSTPAAYEQDWDWMPVSVPTDDPEPVTEPEPDTAEPVEILIPEETVETIAQVFAWPLTGEICAGYSVDALQYDPTMADWRTHAGLDIEAEKGDKVMAAADGTVERIYADPMYGTTLILSHGGGLRSIYCNLAATPTVEEGDSVTLGQVIGSVGGTADAEVGQVSHLHFAMTLDELKVNPGEFLP